MPWTHLVIRPSTQTYRILRALHNMELELLDVLLLDAADPNALESNRASALYQPRRDAVSSQYFYSTALAHVPELDIMMGMCAALSSSLLAP
jgi:hypothetical protein